MGIRFLLGKAGTGKSSRILNEIKEKLVSQPQGPPIFYMVPEQMTFQQEYALFGDEQIQGSTRAEVISFSRLAWRVLQETGGGTRQFISSTGIQMMLRKIIEEKQSGWHVFQKASEKQGFLTQLETMMTEFKRYGVTPEMLKAERESIETFQHKQSSEISLSNKLADLIYLYEKLQIALQDQYMDSEDQLQLLVNHAHQASELKDATIYLDGFHSFTPQELLVIEALMKNVTNMTVTLTLDNVQESELSELDLFYQTKETLQAIKQIADENQIAIDELIELDPKFGRFQDNAAFQHLEMYFDTRPAPVYKEETPIRIAEAEHPRAEVEGVAQEIIRLVRDEHYRYQDIAVFIRNTDTYQDLLATIFDDYGIPVFIDEKRTMLNHALIELIRSAFDMVRGNWRYDAVFRVLKSGFIPITHKQYPLTPDAIDELENYVLEYGVRSRKRWQSAEKWRFQRFHGFSETAQTDREKDTEKRINAYREQVVTALEPFDTAIREAKTIKAMCEALFEWLEQLHVPEQLEQLRDHFDDTRQMEKGREQEQVWDQLIQLIDEMVEIAGDEPIDVPMFHAMLDAGFESLTFAHVPPSIDHVIAGTVDRSRISGMKCAFLLGVNEGVWPMKPDAEGVINEQERALLADHGLQLADSSKRQLLDDWFYMYLAFTAARDQLWISYPLSDEEGKTKLPSSLIKRIEDLFPACQDHLLLKDPDELLETDRFITTPTKTRAALTAQLARKQRGYPIKPVWWNVLNWYVMHSDKGSIDYRTLQSLYYQNTPVDLSEQTTEQLYPKQVKASVSRLEMYYRCSYQHFAKYGLGLEERKTYQLDAPDIGQLFHEALKKITDWVKEDPEKTYAQLTKDDSQHYAERAIQTLSPILQHQILHSSNRYQYIQAKLQDVIARATFVLSEQARHSKFAPVGLELDFGMGSDDKLEPLSVPLANGFELLLRGRIDRVDQAMSGDDKAEADSRLFLRIVDYKSSSKDLALIEVYYGLALQMLAYLDVVLSQSEEWLGQPATPGGMLYFHVHNPMISSGDNMANDEIEKAIFKDYKMKGLLLENKQAFELMDDSIESGDSLIVPAGLKKDGDFSSRSRILDEETFTVLREHIHGLMRQAGLDMTEGNIYLNPYQHKEKIACTFCPFRSVCQFDPSLAENNYHKLKDRKQADILAELKAKGGQQDGELD